MERRAPKRASPIGRCIFDPINCSDARRTNSNKFRTDVFALLRKQKHSTGNSTDHDPEFLAMFPPCRKRSFAPDRRKSTLVKAQSTRSEDPISIDRRAPSAPAERIPARAPRDTRHESFVPCDRHARPAFVDAATRGKFCVTIRGAFGAQVPSHLPTSLPSVTPKPGNVRPVTTAVCSQSHRRAHLELHCDPWIGNENSIRYSMQTIPDE